MLVTVIVFVPELWSPVLKPPESATQGELKDDWVTVYKNPNQNLQKRARVHAHMGTSSTDKRV